MKILTGRLLPKALILRSDEPVPAGDEGGGDFTSNFTKAMGGGEPEKKEEPQVKEPEKTPEPEKKEPEKKEEVKADEKLGKKRTPKDPLIDMLEPEKKEPEKAEVPEDLQKQRETELTEATKGMSPKASDNFRKLAQQRYEAEDRAAKLQKEVEVLRSQKPELPPEIKQQIEDAQKLKAEYDEMVATMEKIGAERSPTYQNKFVKGRNALVTKAADIVKRFGGDHDAFVAAMSLQGKERSEAMTVAIEAMTAFDQQKVAGIVTQVEALDEESGQFLSNARKSLEEEEQQALRIEREAMQKRTQSQQEAFFKKANTMLRKFPDDHPMAAEANPIVDRVIAEAQKFLFEADNFDDFAEAAIAKALHGDMKTRLKSAAEKIAELEARLEEYEQADPELGSGGGGNGAKKQETDFAGAYNQAMATS